MHRHKCGYRTLNSTLVGGPPNNVPGCGFIWEHVPKDRDNIQKYVDRHLCPNCGIGPWFAVATDIPDVLAALTPYPPRVAFGRIVRPADDNPAYLDRDELEEFAAEAVRRDKEGQFNLSEEIDKLTQFLAGEQIIPASGMQIIVFDEGNRSVSGFNIKPRRKP